MAEVGVPELFIVGVDGSDGARRAAAFAAERARCMGARLLLLGVIEWSRYAFYTPEELETRGRDKQRATERAEREVLRPLAESLQGEGLEVDCLVRHGHAAEVIEQLAEARGASEVFVGRVGRSPFGGALFGSVTHRIVSTSKVPVTVVP